MDQDIIDNYSSIESDKSYAVAVIISGIFGVLGIHHFYLERWGMGFLDLGMSIGAFLLYYHNFFLLAGILFLIDVVHTVIVTYLLLVGQYRDGDKKIVTYPNQKLI